MYVSHCIKNTFPSRSSERYKEPHGMSEAKKRTPQKSDHSYPTVDWLPCGVWDVTLQRLHSSYMSCYSIRLQLESGLLLYWRCGTSICDNRLRCILLSAHTCCNGLKNDLASPQTCVWSEMCKICTVLSLIQDLRPAHLYVRVAFWYGWYNLDPM